jgi:hypothetical protein
MNNMAPTGEILVKFDIWGYFKICWENSVSFKSDKNNGT